MGQKAFGPNENAPFPHIEVTTERGNLFIICLECRHYWNRPRGNCQCSETCHVSDLIEAVS